MLWGISVFFGRNSYYETHMGQCNDKKTTFHCVFDTNNIENNIILVIHLIEAKAWGFNRPPFWI